MFTGTILPGPALTLDHAGFRLEGGAGYNTEIPSVARFPSPASSSATFVLAYDGRLVEQAGALVPPGHPQSPDLMAARGHLAYT
ncbi:hypothetical protein ABZ646_44890, partial [Streptomyces sp. NPDC007162]|uniref:hypothetical protein n=1 Tax=Streptomyces sp. NPDC007162 TaxID=3156917 RepID=UPI0033D45D95